MKTTLITGATGFVGKFLLETYSTRYCKLHLGLRSTANLNLANSNLVKVFQVGAIDTSTDWTASLVGVDTVIHLAARAHIIKDSVTNPQEEFDRTNFHATTNLVQQAIGANVKHFIFISSIGAVTTLSRETLTEQSPCRPDTPYGISKLRAEKSLMDLVAKSDMNWTILRPTLVYGPRNPGNMARLFNLVNQGLPLPLGGIRNQRSLIYVGNLVDAIVTCSNNPKAFNQTFILSDGEDISTPHLIRTIARSIDRPARLIPIPIAWLKFLGKVTGKSTAIDRLVGSLTVDSSHIRTTLDWTPPYTLDQGLQATADWFKSVGPQPSQ